MYTLLRLAKTKLFSTIRAKFYRTELNIDLFNFSVFSKKIIKNTHAISLKEFMMYFLSLLATWLDYLKDITGGSSNETIRKPTLLPRYPNEVDSKKFEKARELTNYFDKKFRENKNNIFSIHHHIKRKPLWVEEIKFKYLNDKKITSETNYISKASSTIFNMPSNIVLMAYKHFMSTPEAVQEPREEAIQEPREKPLSSQRKKELLDIARREEFPDEHDEYPVNPYALIKDYYDTPEETRLRREARIRFILTSTNDGFEPQEYADFTAPPYLVPLYKTWNNGVGDVKIQISHLYDAKRFLCDSTIAYMPYLDKDLYPTFMEPGVLLPYTDVKLHAICKNGTLEDIDELFSFNQVASATVAAMISNKNLRYPQYDLMKYFMFQTEEKFSFWAAKHYINAMISGLNQNPNFNFEAEADADYRANKRSNTEIENLVKIDFFIEHQLYLEKQIFPGLKEKVFDKFNHPVYEQRLTNYFLDVVQKKNDKAIIKYLSTWLPNPAESFYDLVNNPNSREMQERFVDDMAVFRGFDHYKCVDLTISFIFGINLQKYYHSLPYENFIRSYKNMAPIKPFTDNPQRHFLNPNPRINLRL